MYGTQTHLLQWNRMIRFENDVKMYGTQTKHMKSSKILIHGTSKTWHIPHDAWKIIKENHYEWTAHSHPTMTKIIASPEDRETLKLFTWQEKSIIIDLKGNTKEFTASTQDWINEILGVTGYDKREKGNEYSWPKAD